MLSCLETLRVAPSCTALYELVPQGRARTVEVLRRWNMLETWA